MIREHSLLKQVLPSKGFAEQHLYVRTHAALSNNAVQNKNARFFVTIRFFFPPSECNPWTLQKPSTFVCGIFFPCDLWHLSLPETVCIVPRRHFFTSLIRVPIVSSSSVCDFLQRKSYSRRSSESLFPGKKYALDSGSFRRHRIERVGTGECS